MKVKNEILLAVAVGACIKNNQALVQIYKIKSSTM